MKACTYCGRENQEEATSCRECGTALVDPSADSVPATRPDFSWARYAVSYGSIGVVALALYFLSLGPVTRYWCRTTPVVPLVTAGGVTKTSTTTYPRWVVIVYYPAFSLLSGGNLGGAYSSYLGWWNTQEPQKK